MAVSMPKLHIPTAIALVIFVVIVICIYDKVRGGRRR
jgi:hypothetical protein